MNGFKAIKSTPAKSSIKINLGLLTIALAISNLFFSPPDKLIASDFGGFLS